MHTLLWFLYFWLYLIAVLPLYWYLRHLEKRGDQLRCDALLRRTVGRWARRLIRAAGAKVTVDGLEKMPAGPAVYVANHQGYLTFLLFWAISARTQSPCCKKTN